MHLLQANRLERRETDKKMWTDLKETVINCILIHIKLKKKTYKNSITGFNVSKLRITNYGTAIQIRRPPTKIQEF